MAGARRIGILLRRRFLYMLVPLVVLVLAANLIVRWLESRGAIDTERPDDRVLHAPATLIEQRDGNFHISGNGMIASRVPVQKSANTTRIVCTGASFMMGTPYVYQQGPQLGYGGIPSWLSVMLSEMYPSRHVEVINAAAGGQTSHAVKQIVSRVRRLNPDIIVVASGNNEGAVTSTALNEVMHRWILYRLLKKSLLGQPPLEDRPYLAPQEANAADIQKGFRESLQVMSRAAAKGDIPLVLCTLPVNLRYDGVSFVPREVLEEPAVREGRMLCRDGRTQDGIKRLTESENQQWATKYIGDCLFDAGRFAEAKTTYRISVQLNPLNRAKPSYNEIVREIAERPGVWLADLAAHFEAEAEHGMIDPGQFFDYCHMTWPGYAQSARVIAQAIADARLTPTGPDEPQPLSDNETLIERNNWQAIYSYSPP
ncbi:MAG: SGNH/GDSL hydrolase family protein [Candidatus Lernaella stagnicola]|nr:SGNH/GDSL hydrolase family protein [Candidatus Lernaella stagnicola]